MGINIGPPPPYRIAAPPSVVVIPGTYVYMVPDIGADIFFYGGNWYRLHQGRWFSAGAYNGPWMYVPDPRVPRALGQLPPDYRHIPPGMAPDTVWAVEKELGGMGTWPLLGERPRLEGGLARQAPGKAGRKGGTPRRKAR